jgi:hypothetical protein
MNRLLDWTIRLGPHRSSRSALPHRAGVGEITGSGELWSVTELVRFLPVPRWVATRQAAELVHNGWSLRAQTSA